MAILCKDSAETSSSPPNSSVPPPPCVPPHLQYIPERTDSLGNWSSASRVVEVGPPDTQGQ